MGFKLSNYDVKFVQSYQKIFLYSDKILKTKRVGTYKRITKHISFFRSYIFLYTFSRIQFTFSLILTKDKKEKYVLPYKN